MCLYFRILFFFFNNPAPTEIYTLSLHDALPISRPAEYTGAIPRAASQEASSLHRSAAQDRKSTRLNSSHDPISYAVFCLEKKKAASPKRKTIAAPWGSNKTWEWTSPS